MATSCLGWYCVPHRLLNRDRANAFLAYPLRHAGLSHRHAPEARVIDGRDIAGLQEPSELLDLFRVP
jgi:hypothetical protein